MQDLNSRLSACTIQATFMKVALLKNCEAEPYHIRDAFDFCVCHFFLHQPEGYITWYISRPFCRILCKVQVAADYHYKITLVLALTSNKEVLLCILYALQASSVQQPYAGYTSGQASRDLTNLAAGMNFHALAASTQWSQFSRCCCLSLASMQSSGLDMSPIGLLFLLLVLFTFS